MPRLRRAEQVARNRDLVLAAARRVFLARGYAGASLEAIAEDAGFSSGVVYSQFGSKADMFFALLERRIEDRASQNERIAAEFAGADGLRELMRVAQEDAAAEPGWPYLLAEFRAIAMRDGELNRRYAEAHARTVDGIGSVLESLYKPIGLEPPVPVRSMAEFVQAGAVGIALERAANPDALPDRDVEQLLLRALGLLDTAVASSGGGRRR
jgi:AcrR family transcriptional regulator